MKPVVTVNKSLSGNTETSNHPAFGQIRASRCQGGQYTLYGSDFCHNNFVTITLSRSELDRTLSRDWYNQKEELFEVALSEAQWATFVSSMNVGSGVPCTIQRDATYPGYMVPRIDLDKSLVKEKYKEETLDAMLEAVERLKILKSNVEVSKAGAKEKFAMQGNIDMAIRDITSSIEFVSDSFSRYMEKTVEKAKIEVNAYCTNLVQSTGIAALNNQSPAIEMLNYNKE